MLRSTTMRRLLFAFLAGSSCLLAAAILCDWFPLLRGPAPETSEWYWPYLLRPLQQLWPSAVAALLIVILSLWWFSLREPRRAQTIFALGALFLLSLLLQAAVIYAGRVDVAAELVDRTLSNQASGFFEAAAEIESISYVLANYAQEMPRFGSEHARTHPPGMLLSNWATIQLLGKVERAARPIASFVTPLRCTDLWLLNRPAAVSAALGAWAVLPLLFAAAVVWPAYALAVQLLDGVSVRLATVLAATLPALVLFAPKSVQLYAPLVLVMFWLVHSGLFMRRPWRLLLAGILFSLLTFLSLGNAALILLLGLYTLLMAGINLPKENQPVGQPETTAARLAAGGLAFGLGAISIWLIYALLWRAPPWEIAFTGLEQHYQLVTNLRRYEWWVVWNLIDLLLFSGWPVALGFGGSLILVVRRWRTGRLEAVDALAIALTIFILVLNFSGTARGEVGRLWLFFMPLLAFPAACFWNKALPGKWFAAAVVALQLLLVLCLGWAWQPVRAVIVVAEHPPATTERPENVLDLEFADEPLLLSGYTLSEPSVLPGQDLALTLFWRAEAPASRPFTVFNHVVDENGSLAAQSDNWSVGGQWPPTCWRAGDIVVDPFSVHIPVDTVPGEYRVLTGLYDAATGERLILRDGRDAVEVGVLTVESP